ncbi:MAG TPA: hybrid sensor histidine kinase/response regulator, partial [Moraxella sp.]|nr:hybrid sensor histidine kinase/response regulator [Moraxella sp.]
HQIKFNVIDTGVGIKPESLEVIFDAYNQADKFTHRLYGGTGLGLSVCKALAEGMGGTIKVTSEKNKGSTFTLSLPMIATDEISYQQWHQSHDETKIQPLERLPAHVLLAEDNELNAMVAVKSLKKYGYEVTRAKDGLEAVNFYKADPSKYHIILMDHQMPIMDGVEATKILKQSFNQLPPIIAVTAHAMHGDKEVYLNAGMQDYCTKPYKPEALDVMIQRWLHHVANKG